MTLQDAITRIIARGYTVQDTATGNLHALTVLDAQGNMVPWPTIVTSGKGNVQDVALPSFHGGKITGLGGYPTAAIYGDVYLSHAGKPAQAEKAIAAMLAAPAPAIPVVEFNPDAEAYLNRANEQDKATETVAA